MTLSGVIVSLRFSFASVQMKLIKHLTPKSREGTVTTYESNTPTLVTLPLT